MFTTDGEPVGSDLATSASELSSQDHGRAVDEAHDARRTVSPEPFNASPTIEARSGGSFGDATASDFAADAFAVSDIASDELPESDATTGLTED